MIFTHCPLCNSEVKYYEPSKGLVCDNLDCKYLKEGFSIFSWCQDDIISSSWEILIRYKYKAYKLRNDRIFGQNLFNLSIWIYERSPKFLRSKMCYSDITNESNFLQLCKNEIKKIQLEAFK